MDCRLQAAAIKKQLDEAANGVVNVDLQEPVPTMQFPGVVGIMAQHGWSRIGMPTCRWASSPIFTTLYIR